MLSHPRSFFRLVGISACLLAVSSLFSPVAAAAPTISEFVAANRISLLDEDGEASDWIEIHNPTPRPIDLAGWSLSDEQDLPGKWVFPARSLNPGEFLVVFASGKNRIGPGPLHTNFRLEAAGEYLGLFPPGLAVAASEFSPRFPVQETDISFGISMASRTQDLLTDSAGWLLLAFSPSDLPGDWTNPGPIPGNAWSQIIGVGVGFDETPAGPAAGVNLALNGTASQSTTGFGLAPENALDGDPLTFTHTDSDDDASTWAVDLGAAFEIRRIVLRNRESCCGSRFRDLTVNLLAADGRTVAWSSGLLNPENTLGSPASLTLDLFDLNVGAIEARIVQVVRTPDPDLSGSGGTGNADEDNVLSLSEVEVYGVDSISYASWIRNDLTEAMKGKINSAFVRIPFVLEDVADVTSLVLQVRFDDGAVVHLNGQPIAALNAPSPSAWNSQALAKRDKAVATQPSLIDLVPLRSFWRTGTNWLALQGLNASTNDSEFLLEAHLLMGTSGPSFGAYLEHSTPGASNNVAWNLGRVADTKFSVDRGFVSAPFDLVLSTVTSDSEIRYTLDGSAPTVSQGAVYTAPIRIEHTTSVRAAAFKLNYRPTDVDTHTYLFLPDVVNQPARPAGFPATWAGVPADYAMDPRITQAAASSNRLDAALRSLPSLVITSPIDNLFSSSRGIYANPERNGVTWERPVSLEWIRANGASEFQIDCGLRIQGGYFRQRSVTQKHSLRLLFKSVYGTGRLQQGIFNEFGAAQEFDTLVLRAGANDGYAWREARDTEQFIRDEFGRRSLLSMGQPSARGQFVHLYLNGLYWGLYNLTERPAEDFSATYLGGEPETWDAINSGEVKSGSLQAWNSFMAGVGDVNTLAEYQRLKGLNADGSPNPSFPAYFDAPNYIDYMLVNIWGGNWDWPFKNFWFGRQRDGLAGGFKFYAWDFENTMGNNRDRSPLNMVSPPAGIASAWVGGPHDHLKHFSEYQIEFADRVHRHFFNGGTLTPESLIARYRELADLVEPSIIAETARWGDDNWSTPQDLSDWLRERDWIIGTYLPQRTAIVLDQLRNAGLYPSIFAPAVTPLGGRVTRATPILLSTIGTELFYTTNGLDPRLPGGTVRPGAVRVVPATGTTSTNFAGPLFLTERTSIKARARQGDLWSALSEAEFTVDVIPAGTNNLVIAEFCYRPHDASTPAERAVTADRDDFEFLELMNVSDQSVDLTGVRFTTGVLFDFAAGTTLAPGQRTLVVRNRPAFEARYGTTWSIAGQFEGNLSNGGEQIALQNAAGQDICRFDYLDRAPWPAGADQNGYSLVLRRPQGRPDHSDPAQWRVSLQSGGNPGGTDTITFHGSPTADTDSNGQADLLDYAFGTLLTDPVNGWVVKVERLIVDGEITPHLTVTWPRNLAADDVDVTLETAEDPGGRWLSQPGDFILIREDSPSVSPVRQTFMMNAPIRPGAVFVRISVSLMP